MKGIIIVVITCMSILAATITSESLDVKEYIDMKNKGEKNANIKKMIYLHVGGLGEWMYTADLYTLSEKGKRIFCPPLEFPLNPDNFIDILDDAIKREEGKATGAISVLLLFGLQHTFPCPK